MKPRTVSGAGHAPLRWPAARRWAPTFYLTGAAVLSAVAFSALVPGAICPLGAPARTERTGRAIVRARAREAADPAAARVPAGSEVPAKKEATIPSTRSEPVRQPLRPDSPVWLSVEERRELEEEERAEAAQKRGSNAQSAAALEDSAEQEAAMNAHALARASEPRDDDRASPEEEGRPQAER